MKKPCSKFASLITGYIDGELTRSDKASIKAHLAECPSCKSAYLNELTVKKTIKERLPIYEAPVALQRRIRRQIARSGSRPGFRQLLHPIFVYRPFAASLSLAFMALLVLFPIYQQMSHEELFTTSRDVELIGEIVCLDCDFFSKDENPPPHADVHRAGIITEDKRIWTLVNASVLSSVLHPRDLAKKKTRILGDLFPNARYVYVKNYELL